MTFDDINNQFLKSEFAVFIFPPSLYKNYVNPYYVRYREHDCILFDICKNIDTIKLIIEYDIKFMIVETDIIFLHDGNNNFIIGSFEELESKLLTTDPKKILEFNLLTMG